MTVLSLQEPGMEVVMNSHRLYVHHHHLAQHRNHFMTLTYLEWYNPLFTPSLLHTGTILVCFTLFLYVTQVFSDLEQLALFTNKFNGEKNAKAMNRKWRLNNFEIAGWTMKKHKYEWKMENLKKSITVHAVFLHSLRRVNSFIHMV